MEKPEGMERRPAQREIPRPTGARRAFERNAHTFRRSAQTSLRSLRFARLLWAILGTRDRNFQGRMGGHSTSGSAGFRLPSSGPTSPLKASPS